MSKNAQGGQVSAQEGPCTQSFSTLRESRVFEGIQRSIERLDGTVFLDPDGENRVRLIDPSENSPRRFAVEAQGFPNLLHEFVHITQLGRLAVDHDTDYQSIPFDLERMTHRLLLWQELSACVVSCAYVETSQVFSWFQEQVGILGFFFGYDESPEGFFDEIDVYTVRYSGDFKKALERAYGVTIALLRTSGADDFSEPLCRLSFETLWLELRSRSRNE